MIIRSMIVRCDVRETLMKVFIRNINMNMKEIKRVTSDKPGVHFGTKRIHLEVELDAVQLLIQDNVQTII